MKLRLAALCAGAVFSIPALGEDVYAVGAYRALTTETVYVFGPLPVVCDADRLKIFSAMQGTLMPPSLTEIGYACATRSQMAKLRLLPPICDMVNRESYASGANGWEYVCYLGTVDRFIHPPTAAEIEQSRKAEEAQQTTQRQADEIAARRAAIKADCNQHVQSWLHQHNKDICLQNRNAQRARPAERADIEAQCDKYAGNKTPLDSTMAGMQFSKLAGQLPSAAYPTCGNGAEVPAP